MELEVAATMVKVIAAAERKSHVDIIIKLQYNVLSVVLTMSGGSLYSPTPAKVMAATWTV